MREGDRGDQGRQEEHCWVYASEIMFYISSNLHDFFFSAELRGGFHVDERDLAFDILNCVSASMLAGVNCITMVFPWISYHAP